MKLNLNPFQDIKSFFENRFKGLEKKMDSESKELKKVEDKLKDIKKIENKIDKNFENKPDGIKKDFSGWSDKKMIKFWLFALLIGLLGYFVYNTLNIIFLIIGAYIISIIVESLILRLQSIRLGRGLAIILAYIIFIIFLAGLMIFVVPFLLSQFAELVSIGINHIAGLQEVLSTNTMPEIISNMNILPDYVKEYILTYFGDSEVLTQVQTTLQNNISQIVATGKEYVQILGIVVVDFISSLTSAITNFAIFITLAVLFSVEKDKVMHFIAKLSGKEKYDVTYLKFEKIYRKLAIWLKARLLLSLFITLAMWLVLIVMGRFGVDMPNKFGLALIMGLLDIIPYIGPFISGALLFIVGLIYNTIWVAILGVGTLWGVNMIQNNVLTPLFMNKALGINSVLIFISMIIGGIVMGFLGVLLAVPIAVIITLLAQDENKIKEDDGDDENFLRNMVHKKKKK